MVTAVGPHASEAISYHPANTTVAHKSDPIAQAFRRCALRIHHMLGPGECDEDAAGRGGFDRNRRKRRGDHENEDDGDLEHGEIVAANAGP